MLEKIMAPTVSNDHLMEMEGNHPSNIQRDTPPQLVIVRLRSLFSSVVCPIKLILITETSPADTKYSSQRFYRY